MPDMLPDEKPASGPEMTRKGFIEIYAWNSKMSVRELVDAGFLPLECDCGEGNCEGWRMLHRTVASLLPDVTREEIDRAEEWVSAYLGENR